MHLNKKTQTVEQFTAPSNIEIAGLGDDNSPCVVAIDAQTMVNLGGDNVSAGSEVYDLDLDFDNSSFEVYDLDSGESVGKCDYQEVQRILFSLFRHMMEGASEKQERAIRQYEKGLADEKLSEVSNRESSE